MKIEPEKIIELCANGNREAAIFMAAFHRFAHLIDDLVDEPGKVGPEELVATLLTFYVNVSSNQFYQMHRARFESLLEAAAASWLDSNAIQGDDDVARILRGTLKGQYHEVFWQCARITGGWAAMRAATATCRAYDFDMSVAQQASRPAGQQASGPADLQLQRDLAVIAAEQASRPAGQRASNGEEAHGPV